MYLFEIVIFSQDYIQAWGTIKILLTTPNFSRRTNILKKTIDVPLRTLHLAKKTSNTSILQCQESPTAPIS